MTMVLGIDGGGSRTRARIAVDGHTLVEAEAGPTNPAAVGAAAAARELTSLVQRLGQHPVAAVCMGAAGTSSGQRELEQQLRGLLPGIPLRVVHDARLVLAAAGVACGVALIAGTGSVAYGIDAGGREARAGGWGHLLGDEGSGYWIVREAARRTLGEMDRAAPAGPLTEILMRAAGATSAADLVQALHEQREPEAWARLAPAVFEAATAGDAGALAVVDEAAERLADLAAVVAAGLGLRTPIVLGGGVLIHQAVLEGAVRDHLRRRLKGGDVVRLDEPPVAGAVRLAAELVITGGDKLVQ